MTPSVRPCVVVGPARILIIDDEAAIRESLDALLSMEGFHVDLAADGAAGLEQLARNAFDLLLLDLALPGESGIDLLPRILEMQPASAGDHDYGVRHGVRTWWTRFAQARRTSSRSRGTTRSCWRIFARPLGGIAPKKKLCS